MTTTLAAPKLLPMVSDAIGQRFEIVVRGRLSERYGAAFDGMTLESRAGETTLSGAFLDQSQLYGLINRLRDLGIELISVRADAREHGTNNRGRGAR
jgi:hypothetical protein